MVTLKQILWDGAVVTVLLYEEGMPERSYLIRYDCESQKLLFNGSPDKEMNSFVHHAIRGLKELYASRKFLTEYKVKWY